MSSIQTNHAKGLLLTAIGGLSLTFDIPLIRLADGDHWTILMIRSGFSVLAAVVIWSVWRAFSANPPKLIPGRIGLVVATLYGLSSLAFVTAVFNTTTANLVFILAFNSMFAALLSWIFLGERPRTATLVTMAVMVVGIVVIVGDSVGAGNLLGDVMAACTAFCIAAAITLSRASGKDMGFTPVVGVFLPFVLAVVMVSKTGFVVAEPWWIVFNGAIVMPLSFYCLATGPRFISSPEVAMFYLLETVLAPIWVWMIFAESPTNASLLGGLILIGALLSHSIWQLLEGRKRRAIGLRHPV